MNNIWDGHDFMRFMVWSFRTGTGSKLYGVRSMAHGIGQKIWECLCFICP